MEGMSKTSNVFLIGLMGAGKTTVGRLLARELCYDFRDSDHEVVQRTGASIPTIFELEGEAGFREREAAAIEELTQLDHLVLATGGGAVLRPENRAHLKSRGIVVYLKASPEELWLRTRRDKNRPLLQTEDPKGRLEQLFAQRDPLYREIADLVVETGKPNVSRLVATLLQQIKGIQKSSDEQNSD